MLSGSPWAQSAWAVYLCDLAPKLTEKELRQVFGFYGDIAALEHLDEASGGSALITYSSKEAAREAAATVHLASLRGKTCRCLPWSAVEAIWKTMDTGHRLQLEGLDLKITSQSLQDIFSLFGHVLDCKASAGLLTFTPRCRSCWAKSLGPRARREHAMAERWTTSNSAYGAYWKAVPLQPRVLPGKFKVELSEEAERHRLLSLRLSERGLAERQVLGDGNCQFRALADQLYADERHHLAVRQQVLQQLRQKAERYRPFVPGSYEDYLELMSCDGTWGDHVTLQAAADALGLRIHVLSDYLQEAYIEVLPELRKSTKVLQLCFWAEVQSDEDERSRGYGFVHFAEKEHAVQASQKLNGMQIGSSCIQARPAEPSDLAAYTGCIYSLVTAVSVVCPPQNEWIEHNVDHMEQYGSGGWEDYEHWEH